MSRVGKKPITVPSGVDFHLDGVVLKVKGSWLTKPMRPSHVSWVRSLSGVPSTVIFLSIKIKLRSFVTFFWVWNLPKLHKSV